MLVYTRQQGIVAKYEEAVLDVGFRAHIIMEGKLVVVIKSIERLEKVHHKTVLTYLKLSSAKIGLIINFNVLKLKEGIKRLIART